jgi:PAS domain S-box-containing protein
VVAIINHEIISDNLEVGLIIAKETGDIKYANKLAKDLLEEHKVLEEIITRVGKSDFDKIVINSKRKIFLRSFLVDEKEEEYTIILYDSDRLNKVVTDISLKECESILDATQDAVCIDDFRGHTQWINKSCEELYNIKREEVIGKSVEELENERIFNPSVAKMVMNQKKQVTILHNNKKGKRILTTGTPMFYEDGSIKKIVSTSKDISELVYFKNKLEDIQTELERFKEKGQETVGNMVVKSKEMGEVINLARKLSQIDTTVLITGDSGVGKGEIAKFIHKLGDRKEKPFIKVNCGAIPESLIESELFGYEPGAFTGSSKKGKKGQFELADKGVIFLDEIGELPLNLQVKILQVIQEKEIQRVGGEKTISLDVRIIAATKRNLKKMVDEGTFREDLYYRLNVVPIHIPKLKDRKDDIFPILMHFLRTFNSKFEMQKRLSKDAVDKLLKYDWPGNVRELKNVVERIVITTSHDIITAEDLPSHIFNDTEGKATISVPKNKDLKETMEEIERQIIKNTAYEHRTTREIAKVLGVSQPTVVRKMNKYGIEKN